MPAARDADAIRALPVIELLQRVGGGPAADRDRRAAGER